jgi:hypothetical protein
LLDSATRVDSGMSRPVESVNSRNTTSPSIFCSNKAGGYAIGTSGFSATGASASGGGPGCAPCWSGVAPEPPQASIAAAIVTVNRRT